MTKTTSTADLDTGPLPSRAELLAFRTDVLAFRREHRRDLPWRDTCDPYAILVSEIMLQQTQVSRVLPRYPEFLAAFPGFEALAAAPLAAVLDEWSGLGYNRRALNLKRIAEIVLSDHEGRLPSDPAELTALSGIGEATASAIATYAFGAFAPFIETNVRSVFLDRFFAGAERVPDGLLRPIVAATWDRDDPREWGYALMDLGTHIKRDRPNPSRRSSHHTKQSRFLGSDRQARGVFLRALVREGACATAELAAEAGVEEDRAARLLDDLEKEGFVSRDQHALWSVAR
jgi:A/G-specific adenine glycosylase